MGEDEHRPRSGTTVTWTWSGADTALQTHTAGLKNFDVQYRVGSGTWTHDPERHDGDVAVAERPRRTATGTGCGSAPGTSCGYVSSYTAEMRIWVP